MNDTDKILNALQALQTEQKRQSEQISNLIQGQKNLEQGQEEIKKDIKRVEEKVDTVDMNVALLRKQNKEDHTQILDMLTESNEITHQVFHHKLKKLEERITSLEKQIQGKN